MQCPRLHNPSFPGPLHYKHSCCANRYFRVSLEAQCPFWDADAYCTIKDCSVEEVSEDGQLSKKLGALDMSRCPKVHEHWKEELRDNSWTNEGDNEESEKHYIDLIGNPERYTGYKREAGAAQVWHEIHAYNTFHSAEVAAAGGDEETAETLKEMPIGHRVFCKAVSGLHTSISSHIACGYLLDKPSNVWGVDVDQYIRRVASHPDRVNNLYFTFLLVLRAVDAAAELLEGYDFKTQVPPGAAGAGPVMEELLASRASWPVSFEQEHAIDDGDRDMLGEFRGKFYNISRIMDCVGCQRCRLWGKLQVMGLGTALRILYAPDRAETLKSLHRNHIVALINVFGRLSHSVKAAQDLLPMTKLVEDTKLRQETLSQNAVNGGVAVMQGTPADDPEAQATTEFKKKGEKDEEGGGSGGRVPFMAADFKFSHGGKFGI